MYTHTHPPPAAVCRPATPGSWKTDIVTAGHFPDLSLADAREKAKDVQAEIRLGADPRTEADAMMAIPTFGSFFTNEYTRAVRACPSPNLAGHAQDSGGTREVRWDWTAVVSYLKRFQRECPISGKLAVQRPSSGRHVCRNGLNRSRGSGRLI